MKEKEMKRNRNAFGKKWHQIWNSKWKWHS